MKLLEPHILELNKEYLERSTVMHNSLLKYFGQSIEYNIPLGGYYYWIKLINILDTSKYLSKAEKMGVSYRPGNFFSHSSDYDSFLRLTYTLYEKDEIEEGIKRLSKVFC
jgi:2-aminoadipate transaminase